MAHDNKDKFVRRIMSDDHNVDLLPICMGAKWRRLQRPDRSAWSVEDNGPITSILMLLSLLLSLLLTVMNYYYYLFISVLSVVKIPRRLKAKRVKMVDTVCINVSCLMFEEEYQWSVKRPSAYRRLKMMMMMMKNKRWRGRSQNRRCEEKYHERAQN